MAILPVNGSLHKNLWKMIKKYKKGNKVWIKEGKKTITKTKHLLGSLVGSVRTEQFSIFKTHLKPSKISIIIDVGVSSEEDIKGTNMFEKLYEFPRKLTLATIENEKKLKSIYPNCKVVKILPNKKLPFPDKSFDIAVSWATVEHVGNYKDQEFFLNELIRIAKKVFVTTPYRGCFYEPHSGFIFIHWLPLSIFRWICKILGKTYWSDVNNLNPLNVDNIKNMKLKRKPKINVYKMFGILPSHLLIIIN